MPSVRRHPITGEPILFAPERAGRPNAFAKAASPERCPFCPGHESDTPPELMRAGDPWRVRVFPNKFPAVEGHEVIVESRRHDARFETIEDPGEIVAIYADRFRAHHENAQYVALFTNHGARAGASLEHLHSQIMPLPFVPPSIAAHVAAFSSARACPLCESSGVVISENGSYLRIAPHGSMHAWEQWIVPKRHTAEYGSLTARETGDLGLILQAATAAASQIAPSHNTVWYAFPRVASAHFYVSVFPRTTAIAGFELGTGTFIDIIDPADVARRFR